MVLILFIINLNTYQKQRIAIPFFVALVKSAKCIMICKYHKIETNFIGKSGNIRNFAGTI